MPTISVHYIRRFLQRYFHL